jgi:DNA mismatch endonuclease (patch repair protein)
MVEPLPTPSSAFASERMRATPSRDTRFELAVRRLVHAAGLRYRIDRVVLPGTRRRADLVFPRDRLAVFLDGCYWHGCPTCELTPKTNAEWWKRKFTRNRERDVDTDTRLTEIDWEVVRIWEHVGPAAAAQIVIDAVTVRRRAL